MKKNNILTQKRLVNLNFPYLLSFTALSYLSLMFGCVPKTVNQSFYPDLTEAMPSGIIAEPILDSISAINAKQPSTKIIDDMIAQAEYFCLSERFFEADSLLKEVISIIVQSAQDSNQLENQDYYSDYYKSVLGIYEELMPPEYLTDQIALQIDQRKLLQSLDSIPISDSDTILAAILKSISDTKFDVPIALNERVQKACAFYLKKNRLTVEKWIIRSSLYVTTMKKMFSDSGLPLDLVYLPLIESSFNPKAYSRAHASGIWQFIPSTGKLYGLRNNYWLDERRDPLKATASAISYLKKLYNEFGHWHLALAAYNCGEGGMRRAISKAGVADYWKLKLPKETMNYVPLYLASLIIIKNTHRFGFEPIDSTISLNLDTISLSDCVDMNEIAKGININNDTLRQMNPHILHWCTPPDMTNIRLYIPEGTKTAFQDFYSSIPDEKKVKWYRYHISNGDNLLTIAKKFKISVEAIKTVNRMKNNSIIAGRYLFIPIPVNAAPPTINIVENTQKVNKKTTKIYSGSPVKYKVKKGDTLWNIADLFGISVSDIYNWNDISAKHIIKENDIIAIYQKNATAGNFSKQFSDYKVNQGDTPYSIAKMFDMKLADLISINGLEASNPTLYPGDVIKVNKSGSRINKGDERLVSDINNENIIRYKIQQGDNLLSIAKNFEISVKDIQLLNDLNNSSKIKIGDILKIPFRKSSNNVAFNSSDQNVVFYEVKRGDNLWRIAVAFGIPVQQLYSINNLNPDSVLMPGDVIKVSKAKDL